MDMSMLLDMILIAFGVYMAYAAMLLKTKGEITANVMLPKNVKADHIKDKEGFIAFTYPKTLGIGVITIVMGLLMLINDMIRWTIIINYIAPFVFCGVVIGYGVMIKRAQANFFRDKS